MAGYVDRNGVERRPHRRANRGQRSVEDPRRDARFVRSVARTATIEGGRTIGSATAGHVLSTLLSNVHMDSDLEAVAAAAANDVVEEWGADFDEMCDRWESSVEASQTAHTYSQLEDLGAIEPDTSVYSLPSNIQEALSVYRPDLFEDVESAATELDNAPWLEDDAAHRPAPGPVRDVWSEDNPHHIQGWARAFSLNAGRLSMKHFHNGILNDLPDGTPAAQYWCDDGMLDRIEYWRDGKRHDQPQADGLPARTIFDAHGNVFKWESYDDGDKIDSGMKDATYPVSNFFAGEETRWDRTTWPREQDFTA